ncbi:MAG: class I SAM-dependent methyltransferase, partial [Planctomycetes bacterium]|nr:class I SAM-dependent methyltransferase [Planctomycetota bacterium]
MTANLGEAYDARYFQSYTGRLPYTRERPEWLQLFGHLADLVVERVAPQRALDVGCAMGFLVESLRDRGVEAFGVDASAYALSQVREDLRPYCWQADAARLETDEAYDLVACVEVLEHLDERSALAALERLTRLAPRVLFSSSPDDHDEATHVNVRPIDYWVDAFAARGFRPVHGVDLSSFAPQAMLFERGSPTKGARDLYVGWIERGVELHRLRAEAARAHEELTEAKTEARELRAELGAIVRSDGWKLAEALRGGKERLLPSGTRRQHAFVAARELALRALRGRAPEHDEAGVAEPQPQAPAPTREAFAAPFLRGQGLEIGALHYPLPVPAGVEVSYVDRLTREELLQRYPELDPRRVAAPSRIDDGFTLRTVPDGSQDFVIDNHVLEHAPHTLETLAAWSRVLRPGGHLLLAVPIAAQCFDRRRPLTLLEHFLRDQRLLDAGDAEALEVRALAHYREWVRLSEPEVLGERGAARPTRTPAQVEARARQLLAEGEEIHFHTFSAESLAELLEHVCRHVDPSLELLALEAAGIEALAALRKLPQHQGPGELDRGQ